MQLKTTKIWFGFERFSERFEWMRLLQSDTAEMRAQLETVTANASAIRQTNDGLQARANTLFNTVQSRGLLEKL